MTDEQIIQLAEAFNVDVRVRVRGYIDNNDGTMTLSSYKEIHYAGEKIIELIKFIDSGRDDEETNQAAS